ncbi:response regulator [Paenibacillus sepulcri]|uniref:Response regulator n=1 Tax=Paenibacillus sepulcri TaxID=359917 RepID=A0ABS7BVR4_9BACL|nr:response regulator [Paenibacillus sepulcri]
MFKLMIVDDELWIREGLKQTIDWGAYGIQLIGEAEDGRKALLLIDDNIPDIVISDIKMPSMNGLELIEELKLRGTDIKVIFISGFSDFAYAQKAVKLGAFDYILKPIEEKVLLEIIERCVCEIMKKKEDSYRLEELSSRIRESLPLAKQKHLEMCLTQPMPDNELQIKWKTFQIELDPNRLVILAAVVHEWGERDMNEKECSLIRYALGNLMEEMISGDGMRCIACPLHENEFLDLALIVSPQEHDKPTMYEQLFRCAYRVIEGAQKYLGIRITIGISDISDRKNLYSAFKEALTKSAGYLSEESGHVYGPVIMESSYMDVNAPPRHPLPAAYAAFQMPGARQSVSFAGSIPVATIKTEALDAARSNRLLHALKLMDEHKCSEMLDDQTEHLRELVKQTSAIAVRSEMNLYIGILLSKWRDLCTAKYTSEPFRVTHQQKLQLYRCPLNEWKSTIMSVFLTKNTTVSVSGQKRIIETALRYIHDNYHLGISLNSVAEHIYLNPSYFSRLFHAEVGETLSRYLIRIRIAKAKELLEQTLLKIYEIADRVGYKDFRHFVKIFKEYEGMTPAQFRNHGM